jgi:hypothetical protein
MSKNYPEHQFGLPKTLMTKGRRADLGFPLAKDGIAAGATEYRLGILHRFSKIPFTKGGASLRTR